jgi:endonuclease/exonuclease/phosphatase family metal-dependent hydrolase
LISICLMIGFAGCSHKTDKKSMKIMTFNVRYDNPADSMNAWPRRAEQLCRFIETEKPDIIGMQEVLFHQYELLGLILPEYTSTGIGRDDGSRGGELNPVFFRKERFDMARTITFWLSETPEVPGSKSWGSSLPRVVTWLELVEKDTHKHLFVFNTHFPHDSESARLMSSKLLLSEVSKVAGDFPFVVTGDFNMERTSQGYGILTGPDESVPLLKDSYVISQKKPAGPSYTFNDFSDKPGKERIDFIFVKNGMKVLSHCTFIKKEKGVFISDHWPVEAVVSLNPRDLSSDER